MSEEKKVGTGTGLELWNKVEKTNPRYTKDVSYGQKHYTAVDAYYQIKTATSLWGPFGSTWGIKDTYIEFIDTIVETKTKINGQQQTVGKSVKLAIYKAVFYYPEGEFPINNAIKVSDDEFMKKLETDTLTKALSRLGFNADVFMGKFDDARYKRALEQEFAGKAKEENPPKTQKQNDGGSKPQAKEEKAKPQNLAESVKALGLELEGNVVKGKTYGKSTQLKALGFKWNPDQKVWYLPEPQAA